MGFFNVVGVISVFTPCFTSVGLSTWIVGRAGRSREPLRRRGRGG